MVESFENRQGLWFGGMKLSESLLYLINEYGSKFHSLKTSVLIFSDGFDTMSAEELVLCLKEAQRNGQAYLQDRSKSHSQDGNRIG